MATVSPPAPRGPSAIPPLMPGDRLSAAEFERRYQAMPHVTKAELIEGVVHMPSPVSVDDHGAPHAMTMTWMGVYQAYTPGVQCADNSTIRLDLDNLPQPDGLLRILPDFGGLSRTIDRYIVGSPELAGEISASTSSYDLHDKLNAFRRNGVQEYFVWRVWDRAIDWFTLVGGRYDRLPLHEAGRYESLVLPGLWLDPEALLAGNMPRVLEVLQQGLASPAHAEFVAKLQAAHAARG